MKPQITAAALISLAWQAVLAAAPLSSEAVQAAIDEATKPPRHYIGDFTAIRFMDARPSDIPSENSSTETVTIRVTLAIPRPAPAERLLARPTYLESFGHQRARSQ